MGKKVGLMTYHFLNNYGTMLQAFALQKKIENLGHESEYIDYRLKDNIPNIFERIIIRIKRIGVYLLNPKYYWLKYFSRYKFVKRRQLFKQFYEHNIKTSPCSFQNLFELETFRFDYDVYIVGSDQVWNPNLGTSSPAFFLSFVEDGNKKAAYAPSIGVKSLTYSQEQTMAENINQFKFLSCREKTGVKILQEMTSKEVQHVLDPTFLISREEWSHISKKPNIEGPYILCYFLGSTSFPREFTEKLEKQIGLEAYYIPQDPIDLSQKHKLFDVGPKEFLGLVKDASFVCTDSFHGCVFSVIFGKQFFAFTKRQDTEQTSDNTRITELLKGLNLESRLIKQGENKIDLLPINYEVVLEKLRYIIQDSEEYLERILDGDKQ